MTDYAQEQEDEVEALKSILMDDIEEIEGDSSDGLGAPGRCFVVTIAPKYDEDEEEPTEIPMRLGLAFMHTPNYPDEAPVFKVRSKRGVRTDDVKKLQALLEEQVAENLGMAMIFTLVQFAKEWFIELVNGPVEEVGEIDEQDSEAAREEAEEKRRNEQRAQGTRCTQQTWDAWFARFHAEMALQRAKAASSDALEKKTKLTGRELFEKGAAGKLAKEEEEEGFDEDFDEDFDDDDLLDQYLEEHAESALSAAQAESSES